jgi:hypothetical protein
MMRSAISVLSSIDIASGILLESLSKDSVSPNAEMTVLSCDVSLSRTSHDIIFKHTIAKVKTRALLDVSMCH